MTPAQRLKVAGVTAAFAGVVLTGMFFNSARGRADDRGDDSDSRIEQGFDIAPVPLNLEGKNRALVGLGSYIVNARPTAMAATALVPLLNSPGAGTLTLASSRRRLIRRRTWVVAGIFR